MIIERVSRCMLCGDEITTEGTVLNQLCVGQINDLKMEHHMRTHHKRRSLRFWYLFLSPLVILGALALTALAILVWLLTAPFWALHELCEAIWR